MLEQLKALKGALVMDAAQASLAYGIDTGGAARALAGAVVVASREQVKLVLELANQTKQSVWPISGGRNFGYGTSLPVAQGAVILDLSKLKGLRYNATQQTMEVEAGVTQADLHEYLTQQKLGHFTPTTGAGPHGSLIGNALDGGYGLVPVGDHFDGFSRLAGFWGDAAPFDHTFANIPGSQEVAGTWSAGLGLDYKSLLRQGNLGVVTHGTLQLVRQPEESALVILEWHSVEAYLDSQPILSELIEQIPMLTGIISMTELRALASMVNSPFVTGGKDFHRLTRLRAEAKKRGLATWTGLGTMYGSKFAIDGAARDIKNRLKKLARVRVLTKKKGYFLLGLGKYLPDSYKGKMDSLRNALEMLEGRPVPQFLQLAYALDKEGRSAAAESNPAKDGQGILWYAPLVPLTRAGIFHYLKTVEEILVKHGFDPLLAATVRSSRICTATVPLLFEKTAEGTARATACYRELLSTGLKMGMPPYRLGIEFMDVLTHAQSDDTHALHRKLKLAFDPNDVVAPGRYAKPQLG